MSIAHKLRHWFTPHTTNNFRAKLLHNSGIFALIGIVFATNLLIRLIDSPRLDILGFTSSINVDEVVRATNQERVGSGLPALSYNEKLADAARRKADDMLKENYWAHTSPSGKSPWTWFQAAGYSYLFAGENLAKDFGDTSRMMSAWMASPTHKENIVNSKYTEIGVAVVPGSLQGSDTVLVVQLFGTRREGAVPQVASAQTSRSTTPAPTPAPLSISQVETVPVEKDVTPAVAEQVAESTPVPTLTPTEQASLAPTSRLNHFNLSRALNISTTLLFILALILDLYLAESLKVSRRVGNNWAHILFVNFVLLATIIVNAGKIM